MAENTGVENVRAKLQDQTDEEYVTVAYDFGADLDGAVERFGADVVYNRFKSAVTIDVQSLIRRMIKQDKSAEEIQEAVNDFLPGVSTRKRKSKQEKALELFEGMSDEEREEFLAGLQS